MSKPVRFVFASDSHGDMADPEALEALWEFCKDYKPEVRVAGGDHFDLRALRRGVGSSDAESGESLKADLEAGKDFLRRFRPTVYLWGNHEHRLDNLIASSGSGFVAGWVDGANWKAWLVHKVGDQWVWQTGLRFYSPRK